MSAATPSAGRYWYGVLVPHTKSNKREFRGHLLCKSNGFLLCSPYLLAGVGCLHTMPISHYLSHIFYTLRPIWKRPIKQMSTTMYGVLGSLVSADAGNTMSHAYGRKWFSVVLSPVLLSDVGQIQEMGSAHNPAADFWVLWISAQQRPWIKLHPRAYRETVRCVESKGRLGNVCVLCHGARHVQAGQHAALGHLNSVSDTV